MAQENTTTPPPKKLLDRVKEKIRYKHYSLSTGKAYIFHGLNTIIFDGTRYMVDMGAVKLDWF